LWLLARSMRRAFVFGFAIAIFGGIPMLLANRFTDGWHGSTCAISTGSTHSTLTAPGRIHPGCWRSACFGRSCRSPRNRRRAPSFHYGSFSGGFRRIRTAGRLHRQRHPVGPHQCAAAGRSLSSARTHRFLERLLPVPPEKHSGRTLAAGRRGASDVHVHTRHPGTREFQNATPTAQDAAAAKAHIRELRALPGPI
jgi:hypothetical protein